MHDAIIIGGGPAGMAVAKCLTDHGKSYLLLEKEDSLGSSWQRHYQRLHLHTARSRSHLPGKLLPRDWPQYVPRAQFVDYLQDYAATFEIAARTNCAATHITRQDQGWCVDHSQGADHAHHVILATGFAQQAHMPTWPGLDSFDGPILHTRAYGTPSDLPGQRVLVIGFGNSGGEIAIDLVEAGRDVEIAVRSPVNLLPKELFGIPIGNFEIMQKIFGPKMADRLNAPLLRFMTGDYSQYGLRKADVGPIQDVQENGRVPLIDLGTLKLMREGRLRARPGIVGFDGATAHFDDGTYGTYDAILMATGYRVDLRPLLGADHPALDQEGRPVESGAEIAPGLWSISYHAVSNGQLRAICHQAPVIAAKIAAR